MELIVTAGKVTDISFLPGLGERGAERIRTSQVLFSGSSVPPPSLATLLLSARAHPAQVGWCLDLCPVPLGPVWL